MQKKRALALASALVVLLGLSGCATTEGSSDGSVTLRMTWWGGQARSDMTNKLLDAFEDSHPGIKVDREPNSEQQYAEKLITQAVGGNAPDVLMASSFNMGDFIKRGIFADVGPAVKSNEIDLSDFDDVDIAGGKVDGKQYLIPWGHIVTGVIYNDTLFKKAGVDAPALNWTWDQYAEMAKQLKAALGSEVWAMEDEGGMYRGLEAFEVQKGKSIFSRSGLAITKEDLTEWYTLWDQFRKAGVVPPPAVQKEQGGKTQEQSMLARGKVGMFSTSSNQLRTFQASTKDDLNIVSYPWIDGAVKKTPMITSAIGVYSQSKHPKEAATLINWLVNAPAAAKIFNAEQGQPPAKKMRTVIEPSLTEAMKEEFQFVDDMKSAISTYPSMPAGSSSVQTLIMTENEAIAFGKMSIAEAVDDFFAQAKQMLAQ